MKLKNIKIVYNGFLNTVQILCYYDFIQQSYKKFWSSQEDQADKSVQFFIRKSIEKSENQYLQFFSVAIVIFVIFVLFEFQ